MSYLSLEEADVGAFAADVHGWQLRSPIDSHKTSLLNPAYRVSKVRPRMIEDRLRTEFYSSFVGAQISKFLTDTCLFRERS